MDQLLLMLAFYLTFMTESTYPTSTEQHLLREIVMCSVVDYNEHINHHSAF